MNKAAFAWGRALAADPAAVEAMLALPDENVAVAEMLDDIVAIRAAELAELSGRSAGRALSLACRSAPRRRSRGVVPGSTEFAEAVARSFFKLLAYKDEYEVARLHVTSGFLDKLAEDHRGGSLVFHMAPPLFARRDPVDGSSPQDAARQLDASRS